MLISMEPQSRAAARTNRRYQMKYLITEKLKEAMGSEMLSGD
jgi:hypothetical protein